MKRLLVLCPALVVAAAAMASPQPNFRFSGEVQADHLMSNAFGLLVAPGYVQFLELDPGLRLELAAPREDDEKAVTHVRLLLQDGRTFKILHEAQISGSSDIERSFSYRVCGSEVTFFAPAPYKTPECPD